MFKVPNTKVIDGRRYTRWDSYKSIDDVGKKSVVERIAKALRTKGYYARAVLISSWMFEGKRMEHWEAYYAKK